MTDNTTTSLLPTHGSIPQVDRMLCDLFITALEGGINYWASVDKYHWTTNGELNGEDLAGFYAVVVESDDAVTNETNASQMRVDRSTMAKAFDRLAEGPVEYLSETSRHRFLAMMHAALAGLDVDIDFDAGDADNILQIGLLGSVVYG